MPQRISHFNVKNQSLNYHLIQEHLCTAGVRGFTEKSLIVLFQINIKLMSPDYDQMIFLASQCLYPTDMEIIYLVNIYYIQAKLNPSSKDQSR